MLQNHRPTRSYHEHRCRRDIEKIKLVPAGSTNIDSWLLLSISRNRRIDSPLKQLGNEQSNFRSGLALPRKQLQKAGFCNRVSLFVDQ